VLQRTSSMATPQKPAANTDGPVYDATKYAGVKEYTFEMPESELPEIEVTKVGMKSFHPPANMERGDMQRVLKKWRNKQGCCYGEGPINQLKLDKYDVAAAYNYTFKSFTENRSIEDDFEPYRGGPVDTPAMGRAPGMWEIDIQPNGLFQEVSKNCVVPHTSMVTCCITCNTTGKVQCTKCRGQGQHTCYDCNGRRKKDCRVFSCRNGKRDCTRCHGRGKVDNPMHRPGDGIDSMYKTCPECWGSCKVTCNECNGLGYEWCMTCRARGRGGGITLSAGGGFGGGVSMSFGGGGGDVSTGMVPCQRCNQTGQVTCDVCDGFGALKYFKRLTCDFEIQTSTHVVKYSKGLSNRVISNATGMELLSFAAPGVAPIADFPEPAVNQVSQQFVASHRAYHTGSTRILHQSHRLDAIPIHEVQANDGAKDWRFWIVGNENEVVVKDYPSTCACVVM